MAPAVYFHPNSDLSVRGEKQQRVRGGGMSVSRGHIHKVTMFEPITKSRN